MLSVDRNTNAESIGYLSVRVSDALGAFPIEGALVHISRYITGEGLLYSLVTDESGLTPTVELEAPPKSESLSPGGAKPYSEYLITVIKDGYYTSENIGLPIFGTVTARQNVDLLPLTEADALSDVRGERIFYESGGYENLRSRGAGGERR